jgi:hypothetical protein
MTRVQVHNLEVVLCIPYDYDMDVSVMESDHCSVLCFLILAFISDLSAACLVLCCCCILM